MKWFIEPFQLFIVVGVFWIQIWNRWLRKLEIIKPSTKIMKKVSSQTLQAPINFQLECLPARHEIKYCLSQ